jgi:hypothetical protein
MALGRNGIVTPGCAACRKRINTNSQYPRHLAEDVLSQQDFTFVCASTCIHRRWSDLSQCTYLRHAIHTQPELCGQHHQRRLWHA